MHYDTMGNPASEAFSVLVDARLRLMKATAAHESAREAVNVAAGEVTAANVALEEATRELNRAIDRGAS